MATLLLSLTLVSQLFVMSDSMDFSNGLKFSGMELSLAVSYVFTSVSMVIVINEFFQVKTKIKGLLALNQILSNKTPIVEQELFSPEPIPDSILVSQEPVLEVEEEKEEIDEDLEFESLLETEFKEKEPIDSDTLDKYKTTKVKLEEETNKLEPILKEGALQNLFTEIEEEAEMNRLLAESEVIATLVELEELVEELKQKKAPAIAQ